MSSKKFPILGTDNPPILGRVDIMQRLWSDLTKATPSNLSIVGPRFIGKTVIMTALVDKAKQPGSPYDFVLYWHLGHVAPASDEEFISQLCNLLKDNLASGGNSYAEHREYLNNHSFAFLKEVTDSLDSEGKAILMLWDGFDKPLGQGKLTGQLWDQMRTIFYGKKHKIVTATRDMLSSLIRGQDAISSPFWNIFDMSAVRITVFDKGDCESIIKSMTNHNFQTGAETELKNWSAGIPMVFLEILNQIIAEKTGGEVDNQTVNQAAQKAMEKLSSALTTMWEDCTTGAQDLFNHLVSCGDIQLSEAGKYERNSLMEKGFAIQSGQKLSAACRMFQEHIKGVSPDIGSMLRMFGTWENYRVNIRGLLERRLDQISKFNERLIRLIAQAVTDIPDFPDDCLNNLTSIEEQALDLIWQREFGRNKSIPQEIIDYWNGMVPSDKTVKRIKEQSSNAIPADRGLQCGILQLLTGSRSGFEPKSKYISKNTYVLINAIHSFRNRNQHSAGETMHGGVAVAAIMCCLELAACLEKELSS